MQQVFSGFGGLKLTADTFGLPEDPAVVLLHGAAQTRNSWREAAEALAAAGRYAITIDLRGHGDSEWAKDGRYDLDAHIGDLRAILAQLPTRPVLVGSSFGGLVALAAISNGGDALASGLVLVDAAPWLASEGQTHLAELLRQHAGGFATIGEAAAAMRDFSPSRKPPPPERMESHLRRDEAGRYFWRWDPRILGQFDTAAIEALENTLPKLPVPTLVVRGRESVIVTDAEIARFRDKAPSAEFADIEGAGHLAASERFEAFNAVLLEFLERRIPRAPIAYEAGSDPRTLRDALGCFGTGIVIATTVDADGEPQGLTANSFTSVSLDPPLVLFCIDKHSNSFAAFEHSTTFGVNVLHIGQQPTSARFAKRDEDRFGATAWEAWDTGAPIISGSLASFECDKFGWHDGGDHVIVVGKVRRARFEPRRDPLLYFRGKYRRLHMA